MLRVVNYNYDILSQQIVALVTVILELNPCLVVEVAVVVAVIDYLAGLSVLPPLRLKPPALLLLLPVIELQLLLRNHGHRPIIGLIRLVSHQQSSVKVVLVELQRPNLVTGCVIVVILRLRSLLLAVPPPLRSLLLAVPLPPPLPLPRPLMPPSQPLLAVPLAVPPPLAVLPPLAVPLDVSPMPQPTVAEAVTAGVSSQAAAAAPFVEICQLFSPNPPRYSEAFY